MKATAISNANIALIKYWGRDGNNNPTASNLSITMDDQLQTITTVKFSKSYQKDKLILNDENCSGLKLEKAAQMLDVIRDYANIDIKAKIISKNTFPHGTGLASSASGFSALAAAGAKALDLKLDESQLAKLISKGPSGSATRSVFGGFVEWRNNGSLHQVKDGEMLVEIRNIILIVDKAEKKISSNEGTIISQRTSPFYCEWIKSNENHIEKIKISISKKDFHTFFEIIMKNSNSLHSVMLSSYPPLIYLNDISFKIIEKIHEINKEITICAYTFDAGPNAHIFTTCDKVYEIKEELKSITGIKEIIVCEAGKGIRYREVNT
jgi:diphosphomevalonate decarboxylase